MWKHSISVIVCLLLGTPGFAQTLGTITGEVKDASGGVLPGATVTAQNVATNASRTQPANGLGAYTFAAMPPGAYVVKAEMQGFRTAQNTVELHVEEMLRVGLTLEISAITETTEVTAVTSLISTENATVGTVIENRRIVELPLNGRNYLSLIALSPNVSAQFAGPGQAGDRQGGSRANQQISIAGQRREFNYYTLDGVDNTDVNFNTYIFLPSVDALEEFKVQTGVYSAEFGRAAGQVNVVTKSGSNAFHGTVFEFHRNDKFDARPYAFTAAQAAAPKPPFKWHQFGYTATGPIATNRLFFMSNWEGYKDNKTFLNNFTLPSAAMRSGDFSALATPLLDPATCTVAGAARTCQPFQGNRIPANRIDPISQKLLEFYPVPNAAGTENNYVSRQDRVIDRKQYTQRIDFVQSTRSNWMSRYSYSHDDEVTPALMLNGSKLLNSIHQLMIGDTYVLSPTVLNEFRFGFNSFFNTFGRELAFTRDVVSELGIPGVSPGTPESWGIPAIGVSGYSGFGDSTEGPYTNRNKVFEFTDNLSWTRGVHSFKLGTSIRFDQYNQVGNQFSRGSFTFDGRGTGSATGAATPGAAAFADFLLGYMRTSESAVALATTEFRSTSQAYYFTDTWRVRQDMTLDLGIRYEYVPPWLDKGGTLINAYLPARDTGAPVADLSRHPVLVRIGDGNFYEDSPIRFAPNIQVARDGTLGGRLVDDDKLNFAPRAGWAWTPSENWSLRAGAGIFYMQDTGNPRFDMARNAAGRRQDTADPLLLNLNWSAPFLGAGTNACGVQPPLVCVSNHYVLGNMYDRKTPYMIQYVFNVQRQLDRATAVEVGYLGSRSKRLERMFDANEVTPGPGSLQSRRPYPEFTKVQEIGNVAEARYNSLATKVTRRLNRGLSILVGYTLAKSEDNGSGIRVLNGDALFPQNSNCFECEWGLSIFDVRHRFVTSLLYELPFGPGKPLAQTGVPGAILGGWQISAIVNKSSGFPRDPTVGTDIPNTGAQTYRPNLVSGQDPNDGPKTVQQWFNTAAFVRNDPFTYGNAGRNIVIGPGIFTTDMSLIRNFRMSGARSFQFRLEAFNAFNQPVWGDPNMSMASPLYGTINTTRTPMRELQLGVKFSF
ncbi:MAG TPA: carboxypeptidase-like regulatory domain-containing protein [Vicinamibacterales bacterium]|nr:carboxypeptidase-like regulatory domain-containing protein [Vicinamibacterales bacterium]